jgi:hypothetical protein
VRGIAQTPDLQYILERLSLVLIFQPFSVVLYGIGAGLVVLGGLSFNLVPFCVPGRPLSSVVRVAVIVLIILVIAICLAIGSAYLYGVYLQNQ